MDAKDRLRRYLEQRREMGERELVLDGMSVEEVLRIVGASAPAGASTSMTPASRSVADVVDAGNAGDLTSGDWRTVLRAGGAPGESPMARTKAESNAGEPAADSIELPVADLKSLTEIADVVATCRRCPLYATAANPVPGEGNPNADLVCVGEAPGANEDLQGRPFVGAAGQLLTKILAAIHLTREEVFICNVLKHRPPNNRNPEPQEVAACSPYLVRQIELIKPKVIIAFGTFASQTLLDTSLGIGKLRGQVHQYRGVPLVVTYHPAALLRNPNWKRPAWEDVQLARRILDSASGG